jgi:hypothetical protein
MATEEEAKAAIASMPAERTQAIEQGRFLEIDLAMGQAYVLAKQFERAQKHLERVAHSCVTLNHPFVTTIAALYLGMALEGRGDVAGAKAAYGTVLGRWGQAKPKSMTAEMARKRLATLK